MNALQKKWLHLAMLSLMAVIPFSPVAANPASSSDEINRAVTASGASDIKAATSAQFVKAFHSVLAQVPEKRVGEYVTAAVTMRRDLAPEIAAAALTSQRAGVIDKDIYRDRVKAIIEPAIAAAPDARDAIVRAATAAEPLAGDRIVAARGENTGRAVADSDIDASNVNSTSVGRISPGNISDPDVAITPHSRRSHVLICHNGRTLLLPREVAKKHLANHPGDTQGKCPREE